MTLPRLLVIQSVEDDITNQRIRLMKASPYLKGYELDNFYAIELTEKQRKLPSLFVMNEVKKGTLDARDLLERLTQKVAEFNPDILIVHGGFVFRRFPNQMKSAIIDLHTRFPRLRIGLERKRGFDIDISDLEAILDNGDEVRELISHIFV